MKIELRFSLTQVADKWVSITVLMGCVLITALLIYITVTADLVATNLVNRGSSALSVE